MKPEAGLILALDIGTSSIRSALFDLEARRLDRTTAQIEYELRHSEAGAAELDPSTLRTAARNCLAQTLGSCRDSPELRGQSVRAVGLSCFWHSLLGVDDAGTPVSPIYTWADSRCRWQSERLREKFDERETHRRTGCMLRSSFWPSKIAWLREENPIDLGKVARWLSPGEWLQEEFVGASHCSLAMASGTGFFNPTTRAWDEDWMAEFELTPDRFGTLSDEPIEGDSAVFPELHGIPWFPAIGDGAASNLGSGATEDGRAAINVGTSAALRVVRRGDEAVAPFGLFAYRVDHERYLVGGAVSNAGNLREWCLGQWQLPPEEELEQALCERPEPRHGLTVLPFWTLERAPTWNEESPGVVVGFTQRTTGMDVIQATQEATFQRIAMIAAQLRAGGEEPIREFLVSGGVQNSASAMQRLADILGESVTANPEKEASLRGAAIFAMEKLRLPVPASSSGKVFHSDPGRAALYKVQRDDQEKLEATLCPNSIVARG